MLSGTPTATGSFTFAVGATNAVGTVEAGPFSLSVTAPNHAPSAVSQSVSVDAGGSLAITLTGEDPEGDALSYTVTAAPTHGQLTGTAPNLTYTPVAGFVGG